MGKGKIISNHGDGLYSVELTYAYRSRITARIAELDEQIAILDGKISSETDELKKQLLVLQKKSVEKQKEYLQDNMPADPTVSAYCADLTTDMAAGTWVGTIEVPGEPSTVLVRPAYNNRAVYSGSRDGQLMPAIAGGPNQVLFNWMMLPGWQRHKPQYRIGTIVADSMDFSANTCDVCLDAAYSSQQGLSAVDGLSIENCNAENPVEEQVNDFCSRYASHPLCTNSAAGSEINLSDAQLAELKEVNEYVNYYHGRKTDASGLSMGDTWDVLALGDAGDCEDFALTKMKMLVDRGWSAANLKIATAYTANGTYHATLIVRTSNKGILALDINYDNVMEFGKTKYRLDRIAMTSSDWRNYTRKLSAVPIEYMSCNAAAFGDGDRVVVEFTGQSWSSPKVIGFAAGPQPCANKIYRHGAFDYVYVFEGHNYLFQTSGAVVYEIDTNIFYQDDFTLGTESFDNTNPNYYVMYVSACTFDSAKNQWIFGGNRDGRFCPNYLKKCQKYSAVTYSYTLREDHPDPARQLGQNAFFLSGYSYLVAGLRFLACYPEWVDYEHRGPLTQEWDVKNDNDRFSDLTNTWEKKTVLPYSMSYGIDFSIGSDGYVGGGSDYNILGEVTKYDNFYKYNSESESWYSRDNLLRPTWYAYGASLNDKGYCHIGAYNDHDYAKWLCEYVPESDVWSYKSEGLGETSYSGAVGTDNKIWEEILYEQPIPNDFFRYMQAFDVTNETWSLKSDAQYFLSDGVSLANFSRLAL